MVALLGFWQGFNVKNYTSLCINKLSKKMRVLRV